MLSLLMIFFSISMHFISVDGNLYGLAVWTFSISTVLINIIASIMTVDITIQTQRNETIQLVTNLSVCIPSIVLAIVLVTQ